MNYPGELSGSQLTLLHQKVQAALLRETGRDRLLDNEFGHHDVLKWRRPPT